MGALSPLFLLAGAAIAVPLYLHLFHRHKTRRLSFPALRYLERTEREHARQIRMRQILLLLMRVTILLLLVGAGARLFFAGRGASHPPTATVIIIDNSLSSGLVDGERRVLDGFKELAHATLDEATDDDRFWVIRAGEPWLPALPGGAADARSAVDETDVSEAAGDLTAALERARRLLEVAELPAREIHLLSDLQASAFLQPGDGPAGDVPVVVWAGTPEGPENRALAGVTVGGGLPPLEGQRTEVTVASLDAPGVTDTVRLPVRLVVNERIRGATTLPPGAEATIPMPPAGTGWILGYADADPDDLRADDRRFFAFQSRPPPRVAIQGGTGLFVDEAVGVLAEAGRVRVSAPEEADLVVSGNGAGLDRRPAEGAVVILPPADETLLPALNRRLADAGVPWAFQPSSRVGQAPLVGDALPPVLQGVTVRRAFELVQSGDPPAPPRTLAEADGRPWAVEGRGPAGRRYLLLASPLDRDATSLPVSTSMLRFMDWLASEWSGTGVALAERVVGDHLPAPDGSTHVRFPSGATVEIDGTRTVRGTGEAGFYHFLAGDSTLSVVALNPPLAESRLARLGEDVVATAIGPAVARVERAEDWPGEIFRERQGPELWNRLLLLALLLLLVETFVATSGTGSPFGIRRDSDSPPGARVRPMDPVPGSLAHSGHPGSTAPSELAGSAGAGSA